MEVLQRLFMDKHDHFFADQNKMTEFEEQKHKKYEATTYYQMNSDEPMVDADRSAVGQRAYYDFIRGLKAIQQLEPLDDVHTGAKAAPKKDADLKLAQDANKQKSRRANWERVISDRAAAVSTYRFQERLKYRAEHFNDPPDSPDNPLRKPGINRPGLRPATIAYLMTPPEADFSIGGAATLAGMIVLYAYTIFNQVKGVVGAPDKPLYYSSFVNLSTTDVLWIVFLAKECFLVTVPLIYVLVYGIVAVLGLVLSPLLAGYYFGMVKGNPLAEKNFKALQGTIKTVINAQALVVGALFLNLSTAFRMVLMADQLVRRKANASVKDFGIILTTVSNIVFDLVLVMLLTDDRVGIDAKAQIVSMCINLLNLMKAITAQHLVLHNLCDAFKDLNEHRLSKFEFAYLLVKVQEQLLEDDVQYNFVEHFYTGEVVPLTPQIEKLLPEITGKPEGEDPEGIRLCMPDLPEALAKEFGHDGLGEFAPDIYKGPIEKAKDYEKEMELFLKAVPKKTEAPAADPAKIAAPAPAASSGWGFGSKKSN